MSDTVNDHTELADPFGWVGQVLDARYRIDRVVGQGGFGTVYGAHHIALGGPVAVKCLDLRAHLDQGRQQAFLKAFRDEGRILHHLSSRAPAMVRALDLSAALSPRQIWTPYLVLEWLEGSTLHDHLAKRRGGAQPYTATDAVRLLTPIVAALDVAHRSDIAHRDVKPGNIFVLSDGSTKILDFGIAKIMTDGLAADRYLHTGYSVEAFSPGYGAPEQFEPGPNGVGATGPWTDVYALALIIVEMVCGKRAYEGTTTSQFHLQATNRALRPTPRGRGVAIPDAIEDILARALAVDPRNRPASAGAFWSELTHALEPPGPKPPPPPPLGAPKPAQTSAMPPPVGGTVVSSAPVSPLVPSPMTPSAVAQTVVAPPKRKTGPSRFTFIIGGLLAAVVSFLTAYVLTRSNEAEVESPKAPSRPATQKEKPRPPVSGSFEIAAGPVPGGGSIGSFSVGPLRSADTFMGATDSCVKLGQRLCTEGQWAAACSAYPAVAAPVVRTSTWDDGWVAAGGDSCKARSKTQGLTSHPFRCCTAAVTVYGVTSNEARRVETSLVAHESAVNDGDAAAVARLFAATVDRYFTIPNTTPSGVEAAAASWFKLHPDQWNLHDSCLLNSEGTGSLPAFSCTKLAYWDKKVVVTRTSYRWRDGKLAYVSDEVLRPHTPP